MTVSVFFNDTATTEIYTLSLHDALPIFSKKSGFWACFKKAVENERSNAGPDGLPDVTHRIPEELQPLPLRRQAPGSGRSEEHTSELQSRQYLACRLLLETSSGTSATYVT